VPDQSYSALYLAFDFSNRMGNSQEAEFLKNLQKTAQTDSALLKTFIAPDQQSLLSSEYYSRYFYSEIKKIFGNYSTILPLATVKINDGKILYFKFGSTGESHLHVASIIMKKSGDKYYLGLRSTDDDINNILWNIYIREAIYDYFNQKS